MAERVLAVVPEEACKYVHFAAQAALFFDLTLDPDELKSATPSFGTPASTQMKRLKLPAAPPDAKNSRRLTRSALLQPLVNLLDGRIRGCCQRTYAPGSIGSRRRALHDHAALRYEAFS